jgi:hypothetical protein
MFMGTVEPGNWVRVNHPRRPALKVGFQGAFSEFERATIRDRVLRRAGSRTIICDPSARGRPLCGLADRRSVKVPIANALRAALSHDTFCNRMARGSGTAKSLISLAAAAMCHDH